MSTSNLYALARTRLDADELPRTRPRLLLAARGSGVHCALCDAPIGPHEIEYEVELATRAGLRFHILCHDAWSEVLEELRTAHA